MPLQKGEIRVPFGGGLDTKTDHKQVVPGKLLVLKNGTFQNLRQITKREAFQVPYSQTTVDSNTVTSGWAIYRRGWELLITARTAASDSTRISCETGNVMLTHDSNEDEWKKIGIREPLSLDVIHVAEPIHQQVIPDVAVDNGKDYAIYGWIKLTHPADTGTVWQPHVSVIDISNNAKIIDDWELINGEDAQGIHNVGFVDRFHTWVIREDTPNSIWCAITYTATLSAAGTLISKKVDAHTDNYWDVCKVTRTGVSAGECSVVAYKESTNGHLNVSWYDDDAAHIDTDTIAEVVNGPVTVFEAYDHLTTSNKVVVAYIGTTGWLRIKVYNSDATQYTAPTTVQTPAPGVGDFPITSVRNITGCKDSSLDYYNWPNDSFIRLYVECDTGNTRHFEVFVYQFQIEFDGGQPYRFARMPHCGLASKAWEHDSKARVWTVHDSWGALPAPTGGYNETLQNTYFLKSSQGEDSGNNDEQYRTDARLFAGSAHGLSWAGGTSGYEASLSAVATLADGSYLFAAGKRTNILFHAASPVGAQAIVGIATTFGEYAQPSTELGPTVQTGGGFIGDADGRFQELGFHLYPEALSETVGEGVGGATTWQYCAVFEWTDREGQQHQSAPSLPLTPANTKDDTQVTIRITSLSEGDFDRLGNVRCTLYRTQTTGNVFYRLPLISQELNDPTAQYIDLIDTPALDATIADYETLYTTGGVVENICPPASSIMNVYQDRVVLVPDEDRTDLWFSKLKQHEVGVSFSDLFTKRITDGGPTTALCTMDSREIVFKESQIRAFSGEGPIDTGVGSFSNDYLITADVGCCDRASVVWTDKGIMFKSLKGIYLLGRNLQVTYIGAPVEDYNQYTVLKAELVETKNQVRFLLENNVAMLVYDYLVDQWSVFDSPYAGEVQLPWGTVDSAMWQNQYVMVRTDGTVLLETALYRDIATTYIPLDLTTSWIKLNGLQGYQRVWWISLLGEVYDRCTINYEIYYDYIDANPQTGSVVVDAAFAANPPAQFRVKPRFGNGKCQAFKVRLYDATATGATNYKGFAISDLMIQIGKKSGVMRQGTIKTR